MPALQRASGGFYAHIAIVGISVVGALLTQRPTLIALSGPSMVLVLAALVMSTQSKVVVAAWFDRPSGVEGDEVVLHVTATSRRAVPLLDVEVFVPPELAASGPVRAIRPARAGELVSIDFPLLLAEWGLSSPETIVIHSRDAWGLIMTRQVFRCRCRFRTFLPDPATRSLLEPERFLRVVGNHNSSDVGGGCEVADMRPYRDGDRLRDVNWRITARHGEPWVTERHPDRASTVVVVVDASADAGVGQGMLLRRSVKAAMAVAQSHLRVNDRVGLAVIGLKNRWLDPQVGRRHVERISEALLEIKSDADHGMLLTLERRIPRDAIVIAITPLLNPALIRSLEEISGRGQLVHVIEPEIDTGPSVTSEREERERRYADRLFRIEQEIRRRELRRNGLSIVFWELSQPIEIVLASLGRRRRARTIGTRR